MMNRLIKESQVDNRQENYLFENFDKHDKSKSGLEWSLFQIFLTKLKRFDVIQEAELL